MKKLIVLVLVLALALTCALPAFAADHEAAAEDLKSMDLFRGTDKGFELERAPTRLEAAAMLVRLLGKEDEAITQYQADMISHPFTDVPDWAAPYVAWLYSNGLTKGVSSDTFGTMDCSAQMYCTFMLRTLGYTEEAGDFTYDAALDKSEELGLCDPLLLSEDFHRDQVVAVSYQALGTPVKGEDTLLAEKLVAEGALAEAAVSDFLTRAKLCQQFNEAMAASDAYDALAMRMTSDTLSTDGTESAQVTMVMDVTARYQDTLEMAITGTMTLPGGQEAPFGYWIKDDTFYLSDGEQNVKMPLSQANMTTLPAVNGSSESSGLALYMIRDITRDANGTYTVDLSDYLAELFRTSLQGTDSAGTVEDLSAILTVSFDEAGLIRELGIDMDMTMTVEGTSIRSTTDLTADLTAWGDEVTVTFPDLTVFTDADSREL